MSSRQNIIFFLVFLTVCFGCKESFEPNLPPVPQGYLVVEGFINAQGPTQIRLSRSTSVEQKKTFKAELNASIKIEGDDNSSFTLSNLPCFIIIVLIINCFIQRVMSTCINPNPLLLLFPVYAIYWWRNFYFNKIR